MKKITGYHGTKKNVIDAIVLDNFKVTEEKKTDNHWLGHGIYFFAIMN